MARDPYLFRRSWTFTAWSCIGALGVITLVFVTIYSMRHTPSSDPRQSQAVAAMDRAQAQTDARRAVERAQQEKLLY